MKSFVKMNRLAMISFVSGLIVIIILSFGLYWLWFPASAAHANTIRIILDRSVSVQYLCAAVALLTGILALRGIKKKDGAEKGKALAWSGMILGASYLLFGLLVSIIFSLEFLGGG